jgi:hypothetical protein
VKTVALDRHKNVAIMTTKPSIKKYAAFATKVTSLEPTVCCFVATGPTQPSVAEVTDDEESDGSTVESGHESELDESTQEGDKRRRQRCDIARDVERNVRRDVERDIECDVKRDKGAQENKFPNPTEHARAVRGTGRPTKKLSGRIVPDPCADGALTLL